MCLQHPVTRGNGRALLHPAHGGRWEGRNFQFWHWWEVVVVEQGSGKNVAAAAAAAAVAAVAAAAVPQKLKCRKCHLLPTLEGHGKFVAAAAAKKKIC